MTNVTRKYIRFDVESVMDDLPWVDNLPLAGLRTLFAMGCIDAAGEYDDPTEEQEKPYDISLIKVSPDLHEAAFGRDLDKGGGDGSEGTVTMWLSYGPNVKDDIHSSILVPAEYVCRHMLMKNDYPYEYLDLDIPEK